MGASSREDIVEVFDALDADLERLCELSFDVFTTPERLRALERLERVARRLRTPQHTLTNQLGAQAGEEELGGTLRSALAGRLRISKSEAGRRIAEAEDLGNRRALTGEPLAPVLPATAAAQREGLLGDEHVRVIRGFFAHLPVDVDLRRTLSWAASAARIPSASASHRRVDPSTSVNKNVTTPEEAAAPAADTYADSHNRHAPTSHIGGIRPRPGAEARRGALPVGRIAAAIWIYVCLTSGDTIET